MDSAYDHIQEESYPQDDAAKKQTGESSTTAQQPSNFNSEVQEAYKAISSSPWAARLGGFWQTAKKQGEQYYDTATTSKQYKEATTSVSNLISHARNLSVQASEATAAAAKDSTTSTSHDDADKEDMTPHPDRPESLTADIVKEAQGIVSLFRSNASKRLKELQKAEDAADEALLKFGSNIRNFLSEAVSIAPPASGSKDGAVLFESKDSSGKKVVHATRFDAQLHVIHSTLDSFLKDPASPQWEAWKAGFDAEGKTDAIARDLERHAELRAAMEKCVPEKVDEEVRRREMLKASTPAADEDEVAWSSDDSDDETTTPSTKTPKSDLAKSQTTIKPSSSSPTPDSDLLKPAAQPRRSNDEKSVADSDASYDVVSGATSRAPGSPKESPKGAEKGAEKKKVVEEESDDDDWE
ncbi:hypothetical protein E8E13_007514 [Curvularia kusanoi]|uniref:BSD domain-containing protein n=1 Tax=Curvularia kusanoi TaxID=90978 RepID=A0A9P4TA49_CURKU|nr:hypothetical protein E8E13_007514 [Curvularia kusanoi]